MGSHPYEVFERFADAGRCPRYIVYVTAFQGNQAIPLDVIHRKFGDIRIAQTVPIVMISHFRATSGSEKLNLATQSSQPKRIYEPDSVGNCRFQDFHFRSERTLKRLLSRELSITEILSKTRAGLLTLSRNNGYHLPSAKPILGSVRYFNYE